MPLALYTFTTRTALVSDIISSCDRELTLATLTYDAYLYRNDQEEPPRKYLGQHISFESYFLDTHTHTNTQTHS